MAVDSSLAKIHWGQALLGSIEVGIVVLDKKFNVQLWNHFMENHSRVTPEMIEQKNLFEFFPEIDKEWFVHKTDLVFSLKSPVFIIWEQQPYLFHFSCNRPITSQAEHMFQNITIFPLASLPGQVEQICLLIYDVTNEAVNRLGMQSLNSQLQKVSQVDDLTGLYSRRSWEEHFTMEYKRNNRSASPSVILILDIDHFKKVNDIYGQSAGDEVIKALAGIINKTTRETDMSGRYDGDKFAIIMPDTPIANVEFAAERIRRLVEKYTLFYDGINISFTISIGIAGFKHTYKDSTQWFDIAEKALFEAKDMGRNQVVLSE
jgi:diguanylate cyclase